MKIVIQQRDREILKYVFTFRVVTYDQVRRKFFSENKDSAARKRIRELRAVKLLRSSYIEYNQKAVKCISLTEKGWGLIARSWPFEIDRPYLKSESPGHDFRLAEVHLCFEKLKLYEDFLSENLLQSSSVLKEKLELRGLINIQADGALILKDNSGRRYLYAVEFEASRKTIERYQKKLSSYYQVGGIDGVIYICADQGLKDLIVKVDREIRTGSDSIVYLGEESRVLSSQGKMFFKNVERNGLGLY
jgi:hypothetical protein